MDEYKRLARERWLRSRANRGDTPQPTPAIIHTASPHSELKSPSSSRSSSSLASSVSRRASGPAPPVGTTPSSSSFSLPPSPVSSSVSSSSFSTAFSSSSPTAFSSSGISDLAGIPNSPRRPRFNVNSEVNDTVAKEFSEFVDTSGDLELARHLEQQENKELEQTRKDEALAREMQEKLDRDAELARRMMEAELRNQEMERSYHYAEESDSSEEDVFQRNADLRRAFRPVSNFGGRVDLAQLLHQIAHIQEPDFGGMEDAQGRRRVHFADFDEYIRQARGAEQHGKPTSPEVMRLLPTREYKKPAEATTEQQNCSICLCEFEEGDTIRSLPCFHWFHDQEIDQWLSTNNTCPICKTVVKL